MTTKTPGIDLASGLVMDQHWELVRAHCSACHGHTKHAERREDEIESLARASEARLRRELDVVEAHLTQHVRRDDRFGRRDGDARRVHYGEWTPVLCAVEQNETLDVW